MSYMDIPASEYLEATGLMYVRGCEVEGMLDENGRVIEEFGSEPKPKFSSGDRTFRQSSRTRTFIQGGVKFPTT